MVGDLKRACLGLLVLVFILAPRQPVYGIPAFARKYGLRCSACHEAWPKLNNFGQVFKDNGYQLMNDRDAPIWQNLSYFPVSVRITPLVAPGEYQSHGARPDSRRRREPPHGSEYHDLGFRPFRSGPVDGGNAVQEHFLLRPSVL